MDDFTSPKTGPACASGVPEAWEVFGDIGDVAVASAPTVRSFGRFNDDECAPCFASGATVLGCAFTSGCPAEPGDATVSRPEITVSIDDGFVTGDGAAFPTPDAPAPVGVDVSSTGCAPEPGTADD
ncbi:hypothetical protein AB0C77_37435 [Streptomyces sp. NPDC048629]|uniref:hypothetical protein n=1 Tax=Streptomyces sp. NPDC048629 TaxID=3154824 RepID=UPI00342D2BC7